MCPVYSVNDVTGLYPLFPLSLWERERERDLRSANTLPLVPLPRGKGMSPSLVGSGKVRGF